MMTELQRKMMEAMGLAEKDFLPPDKSEPTPEERIEAQVLYTALMTDTLLEG